MIELRISGCCEGCQFCEVDLKYIYCGLTKIYSAQCIHENVCGDLRQERCAQCRNIPLTVQTAERPGQD